MTQRRDIRRKAQAKAVDLFVGASSMGFAVISLSATWMIVTAYLR